MLWNLPLFVIASDFYDFCVCDLIAQILRTFGIPLFCIVASDFYDMCLT